MRKIITLVAVAAATMAGAFSAPQASAASTVAPQVRAASTQLAAVARRCRVYEITGKKVAVRRPPRGDTSAEVDDPAHHYLHRGDRVRSCVSTFRRGGSPTYRKCGKEGTDWRIVRGGQIPVTCTKRVR